MVEAPSHANQDQNSHWNDVAGRNWVKLQPILDGMFAPLLPPLLDAVTPLRPAHILDIGCGAGALSLAAAERAGPGAHCLGIDISQPLIAAARERAEAVGASGVTFMRADAQVAVFEPRRFDVVISRFGVMFFDDPVAAFTNLRHAARPGAQLRFAAWRGPAENQFMTAARRALTGLIDVPPAAPDAPGQFGLADRERTLEILSASGWRYAEVQPLDATCTLAAEDIMTYATHLGPLGPLWPGLDPGLRERLREPIRDAFAPFVKNGVASFEVACWLATAEA